MLAPKRRPHSVRAVPKTTARQFDPRRRVIARVFEPAIGTVDAPVDDGRLLAFADEQMVDPEPRVTRPSIALMVRERVGGCQRVHRSHGIDPSLLAQLCERRARLRLQKRVVELGGGRVNVDIGRHDVVITRKLHRATRALK